MALSGSYVFDVEANGLNPDKLYCLSIHNLNTGTKVTLTDYDVMRNFLKSAKVLIGHNIVCWDIPVLERILGIKIEASIIDTLWVSYYLYPERGKHGLEYWGEDVGVKKPEVEDWDEQELEVYVHRCEQDVEINSKVWTLMWRKLYEIYKSEEELMKVIKYLTFKADIQRIQEKNKWEIDIQHTITQRQMLEKELAEKIEVLQPHIPDNPVYKTRKRPKALYRKDGTLSAYGVSWFELMRQEGYDPHTNHHVDEIKYIHSYEKGSLTSTPQMKSWLFSLGWEPETFKTNKKKENVPQINLERGEGLCPSVKKLFEVEPALENLEGITILQHRIGILNAFLEHADENGFVRASFSGLTNTLRYKHKNPCVNLPKVGLAYSKGIRSCLIAGEGQLLCGSDLSGLEDRIKQHFIYFHDPDYVKEMQVEGYDPHLSLALHAGKITQEQYDNYTSGRDKETISSLRSIFKNGNYACQYGAFPTRLAKTCGISMEEAEELWSAYWSKNSAITKTANGTEVKKISDGSMWQKNPVNGFWYSLRYDKDRFSTLVQGTASYIFDLWVGFLLSEGWTDFVGQFHDEFCLRINKGEEEKVEDVIERALERVNNYVDLNVQLGCDIQFGERYSDVH
jgi:DNA polymerase I-like protein with 3'-5' exonuclease and polymerase domains